MDEYDKVKDFSGRNYPVSKNDFSRIQKAEPLKLKSFSKVKLLTTAILLGIVEQMEKCKQKEDFQAIKQEYGEDTIKYIWDDFLTDNFKLNVIAICR